jgi:hypothetical protein
MSITRNVDAPAPRSCAPMRAGEIVRAYARAADQKIDRAEITE